MKIATMDTLHEQQLIQAAQMLTDELSLGWPTLAAALGEVQELLHSDADGHMKNQRYFFKPHILKKTNFILFSTVCCIVLLPCRLQMPVGLFRFQPR